MKIIVIFESLKRFFDTNIIGRDENVIFNLAEIDFKELNQSYKQVLEGSQIILHNRLDQKAISQGV